MNNHEENAGFINTPVWESETKICLNHKQHLKTKI